MSDPAPIGVLLMTYGSPASLDDIPAYMTSVRGGRMPEPGLVDEFRRRYALIGGSPLVSITRAQAAALGRELDRRFPGGPAFAVDVGMRFSAPTIADGVAALVGTGASRLVGIIMSPQYSPILMRGYNLALESSLAALDRPPAATPAGSWHRQPSFLQALAERLDEAMQRLEPAARQDVAVLLTAHSMPRRVVDGEPEYIDQLHETAEAVAALAGLERERWQFCYQSAGHTPEEWLKPDFADIMPLLAAQGRRHVLIAPVQFLADHLEILYDIEIGAREQAEAHGIAFSRTESLNTSARFVAALADVVQEQLGLG